jgi:transposase
MLSFPAAIKVYLCTVPCDMRRSFDGLSMMAEHVIRCNPFSGHLLVFCNRRTDRLKILYWDRDGWAIWYKRLEAGTFQFPFAETGRKEIAAWELGLLLEGIDLRKGQRRKRYSLPATRTPQESQSVDVAESFRKTFCHLPSPALSFRKSQRRVPLCIFLICRGAKELVVLLETLCITGRLQDELKQVQKRRRISRLLAHGIEKRPLPVVTIPGRSSSPSLIELHAFPAVIDRRPKFPARLGPQHDHQNAPTSHTAAHCDRTR